MISLQFDQSLLSESEVFSDKEIEELLKELTSQVKQVGGYREDLKETYSISVAIIDAMTMQHLNNTYRGKNKVTDVLSFPFSQDEIDSDGVIGEVLICVDQARAQAPEHSWSTKEELYQLLIHGVLHVLGYDHEKKEDAGIMLPLQQSILLNRI